MSKKAPKLFISYSHDSENHKRWVLKLATDLRQHMGVDVTLDQWDLRIGSDLSLFMEHGLSNASLVLCVCSEEYVKKANAGIRGAGYERMIMVQSMLNDTNIDYIIPIIRNNRSANKTPLFLGTRLYIDFSDDSKYLDRLSELVARIYNEDLPKKPPIGKSPYDKSIATRIELMNKFEGTKYHSPYMRGSVSFDYRNNSGKYTIGSGEHEFTTKWSSCGVDSIHAYRDAVKLIGYYSGQSDFPTLEEIGSYNYSSRVRVVYVGEMVVWINKYDHFAVTKITGITKGGQNTTANLSFDYMIY